jgi:GNAT superfamily N-acetyltransferase
MANNLIRNLYITVAGENDIPGLVGLLNLLFSQEAEFTPDRKAQERGLRRIITDPTLGFILAGKVDGRIAAMVNILYTVSTALGERVALLEDMVVSDEQRGEGIGSRMLERAIDEARRNGCQRITLLTDAVNEAGQRFYRRNGFEKSAMVPYRLFLKPQPGASFSE